MTVCFIGHKTVKKTKALMLSLKETIVALINKGASTFLFGSMSEFDDLAWEAVTELKKEYPCIRRIILPPSRRNSGTKIAYSYAIKKEKQIINLHSTNCEK